MAQHRPFGANHEPYGYPGSWMFRPGPLLVLLHTDRECGKADSCHNWCRCARAAKATSAQKIAEAPVAAARWWGKGAGHVFTDRHLPRG
jgi:hypothetical protein